MNAKVAQISRLSGEDVEAYFRAGFLTRRKVLNIPEAYLEFDPVREDIRLRTPAVEEIPEVTGFERIAVDTFDDLGSGEWVELCVDAEDKHYEAYLVLASVVDLMRGGLGFTSAVSESIDSFRELLQRKQKLTEEAQIGLFGELLLAEQMLGEMPAEEVIQAWLGPENEEHDFVFARFDAEVKTTRGEARVHLINSVTQLETTINRPLYLLSVQVTAAGAAEQGRNLGEQIGVVRSLLSPQLVRIFETRLESVGWVDADSDNYAKRWVLRTSPRAYLVNDQFPAITTARLQLAVPRPDLVAGVQYRVDVTNLDPTIAPEPLNAFAAIGAEA